MNKISLYIKKILVLFILVVPLFFSSSCKDFFGTSDIKEEIKKEVEEANAEEFTVRVQPLDSDMGTTNPSGPVTIKVGQPFTISMTENSKYAFIGWSANSDIISFNNENATETSAEATSVQNDVVITANYDARPVVVTHEPFSQDGVLMNQKVTIVFSEDVDPQTVSFDTISVEAKSRNTTDPLVSMTDRLLDPIVNGSNVELQFEGSKTYDAQNQVVVTVDKTISDLDGHQMADDFSWSFITGSSTDLSDPAINSITLVIDIDGVENTITNFDNPILADEISMVLTVNAVDDVGVETIHIAETKLTDAFGNEDIAAANLWQSDYYGTTYEYNFNLATIGSEYADNGDGQKRLRVTVLDAPQKVSSFEDIIVNLDRTAPEISSFELNNGNTFVRTGSGTNTPVSINASDPGYDAGIGAGITAYALTYNASEPSSWTTGDPNTLTQVDLPDKPDGNYEVYLHIKDLLGNQDADSSPISVDTTSPSVDGTPVVSTTGNPGYVRNGQTVTIEFNMIETGSGLDGNPTVEIGGRGATVVAGSTYDYKASYSIPSGESTLTQGSLQYTINASDNVNNTMSTYSASTGITYDREGPTVSVAKQTGEPSYVNSADQVVFDVTFSDTNTFSGTLEAADVTVNVNGTENADASVLVSDASTDSPSITVSGATGDGDMGIEIAAGVKTDVAGNVNTAYSTTTTVDVDNTAPNTPTVSFTDTAATHQSGGTYYYNSAAQPSGIAFDLSATDPTTNSVSSGIAGYSNTSDGVTTDIDVGTSGEVTLPATESYHAVDLAGNVSSSALQITITTDTTDPAVDGTPVVSTTGNPGYVRNGQTVTIEFNMIETGSGLDGNPTVEIGGRGATVVAGSTYDYKASYSIPSGESTLTQGSLQYTINASDNVNNTMSTYSASTGITYDREGPTVSVAKQTGEPSYVNSADQVVFDVTFSDTNTFSGTLEAADVTVNVNGTENADASVLVSDASTDSPSITVSGATGDGDMGIEIAAGVKTDVAGNVNTAYSTTTTVDVDNTAPNTPTVSFTDTAATHQSGGTYYYNSAAQPSGIAFDLSATDPTTNSVSSGIAGYSNTSDGVTTDIDVGTSGEVTLPATESYHAVDLAGNVSSSALQITIVDDTTGPTISGTLQPSDSDSDGDFDTIIGFSTADACGVNSSDYNATKDSGTGGVGDFTGSELNGLTEPNTDSTNTYSITAVDNVGNSTEVLIDYTDTGGTLSTDFQ